MNPGLSADSLFPGTAGRILALLHAAADNAVSGAEISRKLSISRTAVWKQINNLRNNGYEITAEPARGYRLLTSPDILSAPALNCLASSNLVGTRVILLPETTSTNTFAFRLAEEGAAEGTVVVANQQTGGKGRLGRVWASPPGVNLYCSIILRPAIQPVAAPQLTFLSVIAVARAIEALTPLETRIKWPNDLLVNGKKVAGLLNEMSAETDKVNFVILGIGVNLNMTAGQFPAELRHPATSLYLETGMKVDRTEFAKRLLLEFDKLYAVFLREGYEPARQEWLERSRLAGVTVTVTDGGRVRSGRVAGIDEFGALLLESGEQILSGDLVLGGTIAAGN
jgi:BirA family biotin operon repressor/biotin-[acetyl-CoA-carboxylase] ligase